MKNRTGGYGKDKAENKKEQGGDYVVIKALEDGVNVMGLTSGGSTRFHHTEKLDAGEVFIAQFTENTTAIKVNGRASISTKHGEVTSGR